MVVAVQQRKLRCGGRNGKDSGTAKVIKPRWQGWSPGGGNEAVAEIFKWRIYGGGDNLTVSSRIAASVVVVARLSGGVCCLW